MSDWTVHLVRIGPIGKHPNADKLQLTQVYGQTVVVQKDLYREGDLAVFLPPDSVLPSDPDHPTVKASDLPAGHVMEAARFRKIFSNGMLIPADELFSRGELAEIPTGTHVAERLGITKYETTADALSSGGDNEVDLGYMPKYTDIEGWAKYRNDGIINVGDEVIITEKIHGANSRFTMRDARLWVGSHNGVKAQQVTTILSTGKVGERNLWWSVAKEIGLEEKFVRLLNTKKYGDKIVVYGEVYGKVQDLNYGIESGAQFRVFDTFDWNRGQYNDWDTTVAIAKVMELELVPELYRGPWNPELESLRNGKSVLYPGNVREGFVMKPVIEGYDQYVGRKIFKFVGEDYKTRHQKK